MHTAIVLAAGMGSRMNSTIPKVLHNIAGQPMLEYILQLGQFLPIDNVIVVASRQLVESGLFSELQTKYSFDTVIQPEQLGTGHAVACAISKVKKELGKVLILYGDVPLVKPETILPMFTAKHRQHAGKCPELTLLAFTCKHKNDYGKLFFSSDNLLMRIVEEKDLTTKMPYCNSGIMLIDYHMLVRYTDNLEFIAKSNVTGEYYLTNIVEFAYNNGCYCHHIVVDQSEVLGVNNKTELATAEALMQQRLRSKWLTQGVTIVAPETVFFSTSVNIGQDVIIHPYVCFGADVKVADGSVILPYCYLEGVRVGKNCTIGPFARIRPVSNLGDYVRVGNFVEVKNSSLDVGTKAVHLTYIGDATIGKTANIGAGTIFCNYDGYEKHHSTVADNSFIGSNTAIIAPRKIGADSVVAAGSVITEDVPDNNLAVARSRQQNIARRRQKK